MNTLLLEVLQWMQNNHYRRASFERLTGIIPSASNYEQLADLVDTYPQIFRTATIKGGLEGLALQDGADLAYLIASFTKTTSPYAAQPYAPLTVPGLNTPPAYTNEVPAAPPAQPNWIERERVSAVGVPADTAPTVTVNDVEREIVDEHYVNLGTATNTQGPLSLVTLCTLTLQNGFTVIGKSACVYPERYNQAIGERLAREDAVKQVWPFLGFRLADRRTVKSF